MFIFKFYLTLLFITHFLHELNIYQCKIFTYSQTKTHFNQRLYRILHLQDISQFHASTPSLFSSSLTYATQLYTPTLLQIYNDPIPATRTLNKPIFHSFGHRLLASRPSNILEVSALLPPTTMDAPAPTVVDISDLSTMLQLPADKFFTSLDSPSISPMLDVPAPPMLDVPARQLPTLDGPAHLDHLGLENSSRFGVTRLTSDA